MLSQAEILRIRTELEKGYIDACTVTEHVKTKVNGEVTYQDTNTITGQSCKISFQNAPTTSSLNGIATVSQSVKLFVSPDITIKDGSKITVTHLGKAVAYKQSGVPAMFSTHQEISLELFERWA